MISHLTASQLRTALPYPALIAALRQAFQENIEAPTRHVHTVSEENATVLLLMPVWQPAGAMGVKLVTVAPGNRAKQLPTVHAIFMLFDTTTGVPIALMDGEELTLRRTAAASALASSYLSRPDSASLLTVGAGTLAPYLAAAHCAARPIRNIEVWGRSQDKAEQTVQQIHAQGLPQGVTVKVASDLEAAVRNADIITCATTSTAPVVRGDWVGPGAHVDLVGGFKPDMREADDDLMGKSSVFVDTFADALAEAGDLIQPMASGYLQRDAIVAELADLASGRHAGRHHPEQITVFKSVGTGIEDLCAANLAWSIFSR
jgi:ornithine cyclodeaminase